MHTLTAHALYQALININNELKFSRGGGGGGGGGQKDSKGAAVPPPLNETLGATVMMPW